MEPHCNFKIRRFHKYSEPSTMWTLDNIGLCSLGGVHNVAYQLFKFPIRSCRTACFIQLITDVIDLWFPNQVEALQTWTTGKAN